MYYHCLMTFCPPFFSLDHLDTMFTRSARDYLKTTGQLCLHEMMHTRVADGGKVPHLIDEVVVEPGRIYPEYPAAYGPALLHAAYPSTGCALGVLRACSPKKAAGTDWTLK